MTVKSTTVIILTIGVLWTITCPVRIEYQGAAALTCIVDNVCGRVITGTRRIKGRIVGVYVIRVRRVVIKNEC